MVRIGYFADVHHPKNEAAYQSDADYLMSTLGSDMLVFGGDQINGSEPNTPHSPASDLRAFWDNIDATLGDLSDVYAIPGNHDIPVSHHEQIAAEYIGTRGVTPQVVEPVDGVKVVLVNTQANASVQGGNKGAGWMYARMSYRSLEFARQQLVEAHNNGDICIVIGHTPVLFGDNANLLGYNSDGPWSSETDYVFDAYAHDSAAYEVVENFLNCWYTFNDHAPVVYLAGHDNHNSDLSGSAEFYENQGNGIYHVWQDHYSTGSNAPHSFAYVDADPSTGNVKFVSVDSGTKNETTVMDVTPSW